ncbi:MAG: hypothetical protein LBC81_01950 [Tannerellaceae bacterium]|jgi:hypothetical protein|nr:hypothetical protein [Tannerellaceae bacterium]
MKKKLLFMIGIAVVVMACSKLPDQTEPITPEPTDTIPADSAKRDSIIIMTGCDNLPKPIRFDSIPKITDLAGTKWKLQGILDVATCSLHILKPFNFDCEECFTLNFDTDSTASGPSVFFGISLNLRTKGNCLSTDFSEGSMDGDLYRSILPCNTSYIIGKDEFRIICYMYSDGEEKQCIYKKVKS